MRRIGFLGLILLAACAPQNNAPATTNVAIGGPVAYYPSQPGMDWVYLPPRANVADPPYRISVVGPTSFTGRPVIRYRFSGRGQERNYFRQVGPTGVLLLGFEEVITNSVVRFTPPMQEYPAEGTLQVGSRWGGSTRVQSEIIVANNTTRLAESSFDYTYEVLGKTTVNVGAGNFEAWRINLRIKPSQGDLENYEIWFVPNVGEVRTREGLLLQQKNFQ